MELWIVIAAAVALALLSGALLWLVSRDKKGGSTKPPEDTSSSSTDTGNAAAVVQAQAPSTADDAAGVIGASISLLAPSMGSAWNPSNFSKIKAALDGKRYFVYTQDRNRQAFAEQLADLDARARKTIQEISKKVKKDGEITEITDDLSISQSELTRLQALFAYKGYSPIGGFPDEISGQQQRAAVTPYGGRAMFINSKSFHNGWTWQLFGYVLHEMTHAALGAALPGEKSHTAEFFRLFHALMEAAVRANVWQTGWIKFDWNTETSNYSTWGWDPSEWFSIQYTLRNNHWEGNTLVAGQGPVTPGSGSTVRARLSPRGPATRGKATRNFAKRSGSSASAGAAGSPRKSRRAKAGAGKTKGLARSRVATTTTRKRRPKQQ